MESSRFTCFKEKCNHAPLRPVLIEQGNLAVVKFYCPSCYTTSSHYTLWHTLQQLNYALGGVQAALDLFKEVKGLMGGKQKLWLGLGVMGASLWLSWKQNQAKTNGRASLQLAGVDTEQIYQLLIQNGFKSIQDHE